MCAVGAFVERQTQDADEVLFNSVLDACHQLRDIPLLEKFWEAMRLAGVAASEVTLGILVKAYGAASDITGVLRVWDSAEMRLPRERANAVTFGCFFDA